MAEAICRKLAAERLGCPLEELEDRGVIVVSAGIAAMAAGEATPEAVRAMAALGLDLSGHETQPLSEPLVRHADLIYTMTQSHRQAIVGQWPNAAERTCVLSVAGTDISDPMGGPLERYQRCAAQIETELRARLEQWEL
jgi:protein-tyrosine-phosphatase